MNQLEEHEQEHNEIINDLENRMDECTKKINENFNFFLTGIQAICEGYKTNKNGRRIN